MNPYEDYDEVYRFFIPVYIDYEYSLNKLSDRYDKSNKKHDIEDSTIATMWANKITRAPIENPVKIMLLYNSNLDVDNHGYVAKSVIDGIRKYGLLKNDTKKYVKGVNQEFNEANKQNGITVIIYSQKPKPKIKKKERNNAVRSQSNNL